MASLDWGMVTGSNPVGRTTFHVLFNGFKAQLVEQSAFNRLVAGSNPAEPTTFWASSSVDRADPLQG